jgi:hypothetical protein
MSVRTAGLPVQVRDSILAEAGASVTDLTMPQSDTNKQWFAQQHDRMVRASFLSRVPHPYVHRHATSC